MEYQGEEEVPPRKAAYLKFILEAGGRVRTTEIARNFGVSNPTGSKVIREMTEAGYLTHAPYTDAALTEKGERIAVFIQRRHRILTLLLSHYGFAPGEACSEAEQFEHHVSREAVNRICASLGHPVISVCGPIMHDGECCPETGG